MRITKRKLIIGLIACAVFAAGVGASVMPASAEQRTLLVTLVTGQTLTVTVDVPPGTPIDQIKIPGITTPIASVSEVPQPETPPSGDGTAPPAPPQDPAPAAGAPLLPPATDSSPQQSAQKTTGKAKRKAKDKVKGSKDKAAHAIDEAENVTKDHKDKKARQPDGAPTPADPTFSLALP